MLQEDKCSIIADYENLTDIPYEKRCTELDKEFGTYVFKLDIRMEEINERYAAAKSYQEGRIAANGKKLIAVFEKTITGSIKDSAKFQLVAEDEMLRLFENTECEEKKLGIQIGEDIYMLLRQESGQPVEMITLPFGLCEERYMERLDYTRNRWMRQLVFWKEQRYQEELQGIILTNREEMQQRQETFPFTREIKRRMENCEKLFREQRMEGYDFRETDLQGAIFINCKLGNSNFSGVNMENVIFVNCDLRGCLWYGAMLNNCVAYNKGELLRLSERTRSNVF